MNIFYLDKNPAIAASYHCDKHVVKQVVETFQILGSAARINGARDEEMPLTSKGTPLKGGYPNHPCVRWCASSIENYYWTLNLGIKLCHEYEFRYGKKHSLLYKIDNLIPLYRLLPREVDFTEPPQCFGEGNDYLKEKSAVSGYRNYYNYYKRHTMKIQYTRREKPEWYLTIDD